MQIQDSLDSQELLRKFKLFLLHTPTLPTKKKKKTE